MKKYLINGLLALVAGGFAASCADHDVDYVPLVEKKTQAYDQAFKEMIGGDIDPNQNWKPVRNGSVTITANADLENIVRVEVLTETPFSTSFTLIVIILDSLISTTRKRMIKR